MAKIIKVNHIALVVNDMDQATTFWQEIMGIPVHHKENVQSESVSVAFLPVGESEVELLRPTSEDTGVAKFLAEKGPGFHHLCFEVDDIVEMMNQLKTNDVRLLSDEPKVLPGRKMVFLHPKSTGGVLIELYEVIR